MNRLQPKAQRNMARFEDGSDLDSKGLAAFVALADADASRVTLHQTNARWVGVAAMRADDAVCPNSRFNIVVSGLFIVEVAIGKNG